MVTLWQALVGGGAIALGVAWILAPTRMSRLQTRVLYLGRVDHEFDQTDREEAYGRVGGGVLVALGVAFLSGVGP